MQNKNCGNTLSQPQHTISRRRFSGGLIVAACSTLPGVALAEPEPNQPPAPFQPEPLLALRLDSFQPLVGQRFKLWHARADSGYLSLTTATPLRVPPANRHLVDPDNPCFSLAFERPTGDALPQATYRLTHWRTGSVDLFLVPIRADNPKTNYEAIIQHFVFA